MNAMEKILCGLQYEIPRPGSYGPFHIGCLLIAMVLLLFLMRRKEKDHEKALKTILCVYGFGALILEALKQVIWSFQYDPLSNTVAWDYQWYAFPFQLCTTPIFISIICLFLNKSSWRDSLLSYLAFVTILGSIATAVYPESCFVKTLLVDIHTMYLHLGSLIVSIYIIAREIKITFKNYLSGYAVFILFVVLAEALNIAAYKSGAIGGETFNMFFISPYFTSSLPVFNTIQTRLPFFCFCWFTWRRSLSDRWQSG